MKKNLFIFINVALITITLNACSKDDLNSTVSKTEPTKAVVEDRDSTFRYLDQQAMKAGIQSRMYLDIEELDETFIGEDDKYYPVFLFNDSFSNEINLEISVDNAMDQKQELMLYFFERGNLISHSQLEATAKHNSTFKIPLKINSEDLEEITVAQIDLTAGKSRYKELSASVARMVISTNEHILEDETIEVVSRPNELANHTYEINDNIDGTHTHELSIKNGNNTMNLTATHFTEDGEYRILASNEEVNPEKNRNYPINRIDGKRNFILLQNNYGKILLSDLKSAIVHDVDYMTSDSYIVEIF